MLPQADVYPAERRAPRDLLRRRLPLARKRGALLAHGPPTHSPYTLPAIGPKLASKANRDGVAARCADPAVHQSIEVARALIGSYEEGLRAVELPIVKTAKPHDARTLYLLQTLPGIGQLLRLVLLYAMHEIARLPRVQDVASSCRRVQCAKESAGKRSGTSGTNMGNAPLTWAFSAAAGFFLRENPAGQQWLSRLEKKPGKGPALTILAHKVARAVYYLLPRQTACALDTFLQS